MWIRKIATILRVSNFSAPLSAYIHGLDLLTTVRGGDLILVRVNIRETKRR